MNVITPYRAFNNNWEITWNCFVVETDVSTTMLIKPISVRSFLKDYQNVDHSWQIDWVKVNFVVIICIQCCITFYFVSERCLLTYLLTIEVSICFLNHRLPCYNFVGKKCVEGGPNKGTPHKYGIYGFWFEWEDLQESTV